MTASPSSPPGHSDTDAFEPVAESTPGTLPEPQVRAMFDRIAGVYDRMNSVMTAGLHHHWRRRAADLAALKPGQRALDVATGTGDLALELARRVAPGGSVVGADFSERMLELAREKVASERGAGGVPAEAPVRFEAANALELPYGDDEFDAATVGFGARNFSDLRRGLAEMTRVVRPGGRVVVLEITTPTGPPLSTFLDLWFDHLVPVLGRVAGDADAYSYLPNSVRRFPAPEALAAIMWECGLRSVRYVITAGGIIALHVGKVDHS
jgi:demethylmenaquinone methyltransferase/2-methoxy-6-polyprenyl-1,4-benzoquinol methylase